MPFLVSYNLLSEYDLSYVPIPVNVIPTPNASLEVSKAFYFQGGDGGSLGKKSTKKRWAKQKEIDFFTDDSEDFIMSVPDTVFDTSNTENLDNYPADFENEKQIFQVMGDQSNAGFAIKYLTGSTRGDGSVVPMSGKLNISYKPQTSVNIDNALGNTQKGIYGREGINCKAVRRMSPYPYSGLRFGCDFTYNATTQNVNITNIAYVDGTSFSPTPQYNFTGMNIFLSGSGLGFNASCRIDDIDGSTINATTTHKVSSSTFTNQPGLIYMAGNGAEINSGHLLMHDDNVGFIGADKYKDENLYYFQMPSNSYFRLPISGVQTNFDYTKLPTDQPIGTNDLLREAAWDNLIVFYVCEIDYDDKDRKLDPPLQIDDDYLNSYRSGSMDSMFEFYYNNKTSIPNSNPYVVNGSRKKSDTFNQIDKYNRARLDFSILTRYFIDDGTSAFETASGFFRDSRGKTLSLDTYRYYDSYDPTESDANDYRVIEKENRLQIYNDSFGVNDFKLGLTSKVINTIDSNYQESLIASATLTKIDDFKIQRGIYDEDYKYLPYDNYDRDYAKSRNKFMIMHHAFNTKTNTYFWGMNGIHNWSSNFVAPSAFNSAGTAAAGTQFIYFGNFCPENDYVDGGRLPSSVAQKKWSANITNNNQLFDAVKLNVYDVLAYIDTGDGSNGAMEAAIEIIYQNLKSEYSKKAVFGGAVTPPTGAYTAYLNESLFPSEITASGIHYDESMTNQIPLYGPAQALTKE
jgi:hypothetical protein